MRSQRPFGVSPAETLRERQSPAEGNPPAALAHRAGVPPVEATGVGMLLPYLPYLFYFPYLPLSPYSSSFPLRNLRTLRFF
jgi:hypothetical protein